MDKDAIANGGMLVVATTVPDEREWIQWRGRTARQDKPGQYQVVLNRRAEPFASNPSLADQVASMRSGDERLARLLEVQDETIGATLKKYQLDQELGEQINELTEAFFREYPRSFDAEWPSNEHREKDLQLRALFEQLQANKGSSVKYFQSLAKDKLGISFSNDQTAWQMSDMWKRRREGEMAGQASSQH